MVIYKPTNTDVCHAERAVGGGLILYMADQHGGELEVISMELCGNTSKGSFPYLQVTPISHVKAQEDHEDTIGPSTHHTPLVVGRGGSGLGVMRNNCISQVAISLLIPVEVDFPWTALHGGSVSV